MEFIRNFDFDWKLTLLVLIILISASITARISRWLITRFFQSAADRLNLDATRYKFFKNAASALIWIGAFATVISLIPVLRTFAVTLFAGAGILVAILGFAAQEAFSNIIGGVFIVIFKPFRINDMIKVGSLDYGIVEDITLRHTIIRNFENKRIVIPNAVINNETIVNDSIEDQKVCRFVDVGISYDSDVELATQILQEESEKLPNCIDGRTAVEIKKGRPKVEVRLLRFGDSSVDLRAYVWTNDPQNANRLHSEINKAIKKRFDDEGIEIPFPHRTIVYKNDLPKNA